MSTDIRVGDCRSVLASLDSSSVQCCVTSPPYFGLRDYGVAGQIGLEPTPAEYVAEMVAVFREVRRVLKDDGTLWLNLGDSYARAPEKGGSGTPNGRNVDRMGYAGGLRISGSGRLRIRRDLGREARLRIFDRVCPSVLDLNAKIIPVVRLLDDLHRVLLAVGDNLVLDDLRDDIAQRLTLPVEQVPRELRDDFSAVDAKPKDLLGVPWRVALALQEDGWYLRSDIIWAKPNPMPESVTDRPTKAHEYLFLLAKSERYFYDAEAVAEEITTDRAPSRKAKRTGAGHVELRPNGTEYDGEGTHRNRRSVWTVATAPYSGAHFATFPPALIEPCIMAGSRVGDTILDPFGGAGTTGLVADRLNRNALLIELNPAYASLARDRITDDNPLFAEVVA